MARAVAVDVAVDVAVAVAVAVAHPEQVAAVEAEFLGTLGSAAHTWFHFSG